MIKPPMPENEEARLQALRSYDILDTPPEQEYDDITLLAAQICDTPIAAISLIDSERQWFKSKIGLKDEETTRNIAFCSYAVIPDSFCPLVVEDASKDERFAENPLVTEDPNIRFYVSAPLVTPDNYIIGALCVFDCVPRQLADAQIVALQTLARQITTKLELRRVSALLQKSNEQLQNLSLTDELTGLYNRRGFLLHAEQRLKVFRSRRDRDGLWLMMADMDKLKPINDNFGHQEGSSAIVSMAGILRQTFRGSDIIARNSGDEFAVLIASAIESSDRTIAKRLQSNLDQHNANSEKTYKLSVSFGIVSVELDDPASIEEIMKQADKKCMSRSKASSRRVGEPVEKAETIIL